MKPLLRLSRIIDAVNSFIGRLSTWLVLAMVLIGAFNAVARYLGRFTGTNLSSNAYIEMQWYLFSIVFLAAGAWALQQ
ncbi:MAG: C4-dicarboxylate ABC transporter substrate-binding protein, partial [Bacteroidota bacterium]